jgi:ATP-dependent RNA helicase DeaD
VGWKESRILLAWGRRGGLKLEWRAVPTPAEIREAQAAKLLDGIQGSASAALLSQAAQMLKDADPVRLVAGLLGLVQADQASGFDLPNEPEKKAKPRFDSVRERKEGGPRPQRTYAERAAARGEAPKPDSFSKTRPDGSFKPRREFDEKPRPYVKPRPEPRKTWEDRPAAKDAPRPWKASAPKKQADAGPVRPWKKKG